MTPWRRPALPLLKAQMTRNFRLAPAYLAGLLGLLVLDGCSDATSGSGHSALGGSAGAETAGAGGSADPAGDDADGDDAGAGGIAPGHAGGSDEPGSAGSAGDPSTDVGIGGASGTDGIGGAAPGAGSGGMAATGGKAGSGSAGSTGQAEVLMVPCDVYAAYSVCRDCHGSPPNGSPMPLVTLVDLQLFADSSLQAIFTGSMPAEGSLSPAEETLILDWLEDGAKGVPQASCP
jgi:hypothetical protein